MATSLDFSRAVHLNLKAKAGRKFPAAITFARDDSATVDFSGNILKFRLYDKFATTALTEYSEGGGFSFLNDTVTFNTVIEDHITEADYPKGTYYYEFYDETNLQAIAYGKFELI